MELVDTAETKQLQMEVTLFGRMFRRFYKRAGDLLANFELAG